MKSMKTTINSLTIHYLEKGNISPLPMIFLHGFPFSAQMWEEQLACVAPFCRAIAPNLRGHGLSDVGDGQYTIEGHVDDLIALMDHLAIKKAIVVGLSMGGYIALRAIERESERFAGLVLCNTRSEADSNEAKIKRAATIREIKANGVHAFAEGFLKTIFAKETLKNKQEIVQKIKEIIETTSPLSLTGTLLALAARTDTTSSLSKIKVPTLIMVGDQDTLTPPSASEAMHEKITGSKLHIIPHAAHMSNLENADEFNRHLIDFLRHIGS